MAEPFTMAAIGKQAAIPLALKGMDYFLGNRKARQEEKKREQEMRVQALIQSLSQNAGQGQAPTGMGRGTGLSILSGLNSSVSDPLLQKLLPQLFSQGLSSLFRQPSPNKQPIPITGM
tara:strand:- start:307 stop:660 length:354 start_codon:yes stop_codon:yes gene_type:complete